MNTTRRGFFGFIAGAAVLVAAPAVAIYRGISIRYGKWKYGDQTYDIEIDAGGVSVQDLYEFMKEQTRR